MFFSSLYLMSEITNKFTCYLHSKDKHFQTSTKYSGLNLSLVQPAFEKLVKKDDVLAEV